MDKTKLERFITKYSLGGACESVVLKATSGKLSVRAISADKDVLVELQLANTGFPDGEFGIRDTKKLRSILAVLGDQIQITSVITNDMLTGISFSDGHTETVYALADPSIYPQVPGITKLPNTAFHLKLDERLIQTYVRAKNALPDAPFIEISKHKKTGKLIGVIGGNANVNTDRISISLDTVEHDIPADFVSIKYKAEYLKEVLIANKEISDSVMEIKINAPGLVKIAMDDFTGTYYLVHQT